MMGEEIAVLFILHIDILGGGVFGASHWVRHRRHDRRPKLCLLSSIEHEVGDEFADPVEMVDGEGAGRIEQPRVLDLEGDRRLLVVADGQERDPRPLMGFVADIALDALGFGDEAAALAKALVS